jgi:hypothetical protein
MQLSINELSQLTGRDRRTITTKLEDLPYEDGPKGAKLYDSALALEKLYTADSRRGSLDEARISQALSQAQLNTTKDEELRRIRIPIHIPLAANDQALQSISATLKAAQGKPLTYDLINLLLDKLRAIPAALKW